ncbi:helix-turn-helix transcriptional regulator [Catenuloplanes atrovinosus]|uniref:HTH luxR-type domain-containing protein n=1 Tax=Catenuloplanes atrovinosus TaxID=137266 RepID=A0AAE3YRD3_9ACTN|nr:AAA family ATPase [Catenuloplanes atrovinosus]MDR7277285.1 hypothetical protein [Catenuloplanes atrovinosus]
MTTVDPVLTVLAGPSGIGRSTALRRICARIKADGGRVLPIPLTPPEEGLPLHLLGRLAVELGAPASQPVRPGPVADPSRWQAAALVRGLAGRGRLLVALDDAQWADAASAALLEQIVHGLRATETRLICTVRLVGTAPGDPAAAALGRLRDAGLAEVVRLRPLTDAGIATMLCELTGARRVRPRVIRWMRALTGGLPAVLHATVTAYGDAGAFRIADHELCGLGTAPGAARAVTGHLRGFDDLTLSVAGALDVLRPLGPAAEAVAAEALDLGPEQVRAGVHALARAGVTRPDRRGGWSFTAAVMGTAARARLGHYRRRQIARCAADAVRAGRTEATPPSALADWLSDAGALVEPRRAAAQLVTLGRAGLAADAGAAVRWLRTATALTDDPAVSMSAMLAQAQAAEQTGDPATARDLAGLLLQEHAARLGPDRRRHALLLYLRAVRGRGDHETLHRVARGAGHGPLPASDPVLRAAAHALRGEWAPARSLLDSVTGDGLDPETALLVAVVAAVSGSPSALYRLRPSPAAVAPEAHRRLLGQANVLLLLGDVTGAEEALAAGGLDAGALGGADRLMRAWRTGRWDDVPCIAAEDDAGATPLSQVGAAQAAAAVRLSCGRPGAAVAILDAARAAGAVLPHLLDSVAATVARAIGTADEAAERVTAGLAAARHSGAVIGTDELWLQATEISLDRGDREAAARAVAAAARTAGRLGTGPAVVHHLVARALLDADPGAAAEAVRAARPLRQPYLLARALVATVRAGGDPAALSEAYDLLGGLGAVLDRYWLRLFMRAHHVPVPHRAVTSAEDQTLIMYLVAEGLSNRQLARVLRISEKSVEGRLTRLFQRTGYRSRVDLVTAVLSGGPVPG